MTGFNELLISAATTNKSLLCVGLDSDPAKLPLHLRDRTEAILEFNYSIIDATADIVCAYKPNAAFYSGSNSEKCLEETINYIKMHYPKIPVILDSKRGDIGNTAQLYAKESFDRYGADAVTVSPYMGRDSLEPFIQYKNKGVIILCRTSNVGAKDIQDLNISGTPLYLHIAKLAATEWNENKNIGLVAGATAPLELKEVRALVGDSIPLLIPGVGAQGGNVTAVVQASMNAQRRGIIINASRSVIFASQGKDFAEAARREALLLNQQINESRS